MITDARALRPDTVPRDLHHRNAEIDHLSSVLDPVTRGRQPEDILIHGPSGAGKTTLAKHTVGKLEHEALSVEWAYVNCMADSSHAALLFQVVRDADLGADLRREGTHAGVALDRLRDADEHVVVVIDEVDVLQEARTLLALYEIPSVSLVLICVDADDWLTQVDPRVESRFRSAESLRLDKYTHDELVDILDARVEHGLIRSRVGDGTIEYLADLAAGDARRGIALLRRGAKHIEEEDLDELTPSVIDDVEADAEAEMRERRVRSLGTHQRILFEIVREAGEIGVGDLHDQYEQRAQAPRARSTRRKYLSSLQRYDLIERCGGNGPAAKYRLVK